MYAENILNILKCYVDNQFSGNVSAAATYLGISSHTLRRWLLEERSPMLSELGKALDLIGVMTINPEKVSGHYTMIPKIEALSGAGSSLSTSSDILGFYAFPQSFLYQLGINQLKSVLIDVIGHSMEPLLHQGDTLLVDQSSVELISEKIFLVGLGEDLLVKRVLNTNRGWVLHSENNDYTDILISEYDVNDFRVIGRVRWFGRVL